MFLLIHLVARFCLFLCVSSRAIFNVPAVGHTVYLSRLSFRLTSLLSCPPSRRTVLTDAGAGAEDGGGGGIRPDHPSQLPFIYLTDGLDMDLDSEGGGTDDQRLLLQAAPSGERPQTAHQNDFCE